MEMMQIGQKVSGSYFGAAFAGEITDRRPHTMNAGIVYFVKLAAPIVALGDERDALCLTIGDGSGYPVTMEAA